LSFIQLSALFGQYTGINYSMLSGRLSPSHGAPSGCTRSRRAPDMDDSWECTEWRVADSRQGVVHHNGGAEKS